MQNTGNFDTGVGHKVKDDVVTQSKAADVRDQLWSQSAQFRRPAKLLTLQPKATDKLVSGFEIIGGDVSPDFGEVRLR
jgi:hypothetical protein